MNNIALYVFCFILKFILPKNKFLVTLRRRYGHDHTVTVRNLDRLLHKINKTRLDIDFLEKCQRFNVIPKFLHFKLANNRLRNSKTYREIQLRLLQEEINHHKKCLRDVLPRYATLLDELKTKTKWYDMLIIESKLNEFSKKTVHKVKERHDKKLKNLCQKRIIQDQFDPDKLIYNFTDRTLNADQKSALMKGLKYGLPPTKPDDIEIFSSFERCFQELRRLNINSGKISLERFKNKFAEQAYSYCDNYKVEDLRNLTDSERKGLKELYSDRSIVVCKADKGNCVVLLKKDEYINRMKEILSDQTKFRELQEDPTIKRENKLVQFLLRLKKDGSITESFYEKVRPSGSQPARLYGLPKIHKPNHPLRPICSSVQAYNYKLASELASILTSHASNSFTVRSTFDFVNEINGLTSNKFHICSFDVTSLFTCIPINETIDIAIHYAFENTDKIQGLTRKNFKKLLEMSTKETNFSFNDKIYDQIDGVAMGSPLAPVMANIFMRYLEEKFSNFGGVLPAFYRRYVDDSFLLFENKNDVGPFYEFMNSLHPNIKFTLEEESPGSLSFAFLDVKIMRSDNTFTTQTYFKPTFTGLYTNWFSFTPRKYKINLVKCLLSRAWKICSNQQLFSEDWLKIKENLVKNQYPEALLNALQRNFVEKQNNATTETDPVTTVPKIEVSLVLPYHGFNLSTKLNKSLISLLSIAYPQVELKVIFRTTFRLSHLFSIKDKIPKRLTSFVVYCVHCTNCDAKYIGKTKRHMITRFKEHLKPQKPTAITDHILRNNHDVNINDVNFLARGKNDYDLLIKESLLVKRLSPSLNSNVSSFPLELF